MKALRRSIKGEKDKPAQITIAPKSAVAIVPPKKVIRALYDYEAASSQELSFSRGDFFHVIGRENDPDWYEACNPALPDARGLVPVAFFQALGRTERDSAQSDTSVTRQSPSAKSPDHDSGYGEATAAPAPAASQRSSKSGGKSGGMVYGIVMYDFQAERADELQAREGEAIIVIAQSNPEWFVAKPIGRLGGPGLIPVSFVEIRDMGTNQPVPDPHEAVKRAGIPRVEEWKKMAAEYKNSSITLGKFEVGGAGQQQSIEQGMERMSLQQQPGMGQGQMNGSPQSSQVQQTPQPAQQNTYNPQRNTQQGMQQGPYGQTPSAQLLAPVKAYIPRYCFAEEKYWFVIEAELEDGRQWELSRYYEDFYDFQIALLTEFPAEAGNTGTQKRTLPYMPGPVNYVTDAITEGRLHNLDAYVKNLLAQPPKISRCNLVKQFFAPREGDYEMDSGTGPNDYRMSSGSQPSSLESPDGASRQSSKNNLNGNGYSNTSGGPGRATNGQSQLPRQTSSFSQPPQASIAPGVAQAGAAMKVKIRFNGDLIAMRVPQDIQYEELYAKIRERLAKSGETKPFRLYYNDMSDKVPITSNPDLDLALQRTDNKLLVEIELV